MITLIVDLVCSVLFFVSYANSILDGDEHEQVKSLYDYRLELLRTHPGSTVMFKYSEGRFEGMYVCLAPLKAGFMVGCRPVISLDWLLAERVIWKATPLSCGNRCK